MSDPTILVLLTPIGLDAGTWEALELPEARVAAHEYPGHGDRPRGTPPPGLPELADEVAAAYPGRLDLVGVSLGAMVATHLALRHPDRVRSLLLACTGAAADRPAIQQRAADAEALGMQGVLDDTLARWFTAEALARRPEHPGVAYARRTLMALDPRSFADGWRAIAEHDVRDRLPEIRAATTCVGGSADVAAPPTRVRELAEGIPGARLELIDGPHMLQLERPADFSRSVAGHLRAVKGA